MWNLFQLVLESLIVMENCSSYHWRHWNWKCSQCFIVQKYRWFERTSRIAVSYQDCETGWVKKSLATCNILINCIYSHIHKFSSALHFKWLYIKVFHWIIRLQSIILIILTIFFVKLLDSHICRGVCWQMWRIKHNILLIKLKSIADG